MVQSSGNGRGLTEFRGQGLQGSSKQEGTSTKGVALLDTIGRFNNMGAELQVGRGTPGECWEVRGACIK